MIIIIAAQICGRIFSYLHQPPVIGEIISGILLGPSLFGKIFPEFQKLLIPDKTVPFIGVFAQLGIVLYMFVVGMELDFQSVKKSSRAILVISYVGMALPFLCGILLAYGLFEKVSERGVGFTGFSFFFGVSLAITAFPVLARILDDSHLRKTKLGEVALACAAVGDATAWCLLAVAVSIVKVQGADIFKPVFYTAVFVVGMLVIVRPLVGYLVKWFERLKFSEQGALTILLAGALFLAIITEWIGIHAIFGAFLFGAVLPHDSKISVSAGERLQDFVKVLFLPAFFAFTGMRTEISFLSGANDWLIYALIILVATSTKFYGAYFAARVVGFERREAGALGALLNARGLVELIVLNIGLDLAIISPRLFTMLVIMAVTTTFLTTPLTFWILRPSRWNAIA